VAEDMLLLDNKLLDEDGNVYIVSDYDDNGEPIYKLDPNQQMDLGESSSLPTGWTIIQVSEGYANETYPKAVYIMKDGQALDDNGKLYSVTKDNGKYMGKQEDLQLNPENWQIEDPAQQPNLDQPAEPVR
jgi:hypothetical protein